MDQSKSIKHGRGNQRRAHLVSQCQAFICQSALRTVPSIRLQLHLLSARQMVRRLYNQLPYLLHGNRCLRLRKPGIQVPLRRRNRASRRHCLVCPDSASKWCEILTSPSFPLTDSISKGTDKNVTLGKIMRDYYVSFATALDPNANAYSDVQRPYWPTYMSKKNQDFAVLDVSHTSIDVVRDADASPQCDFFHAQSYVVRN